MRAVGPVAPPWLVQPGPAVRFTVSMDIFAGEIVSIPPEPWATGARLNIRRNAVGGKRVAFSARRQFDGQSAYLDG